MMSTWAFVYFLKETKNVSRQNTKLFSPFLDFKLDFKVDLYTNRIHYMKQVACVQADKDDECLFISCLVLSSSQ